MIEGGRVVATAPEARAPCVVVGFRTNQVFLFMANQSVGKERSRDDLRQWQLTFVREGRRSAESGKSTHGVITCVAINENIRFLLRFSTSVL